MTRRIRLYSGLILFLYVTTHLLNHALGLISIDAMELGRGWFLGLWRNPVGSIVVQLALLVHFGLALWALYRRDSLKMTFGEAAQIALGIAIPLLLIGHIIGTRIAHEFAGVVDTYAWVLLIHWKLDPMLLVNQIGGLLAAWIHGCIGVHYWLRLKPRYPSLTPYLFALALLVPVLSLLGYTQAGQDVLRLAENAEWVRGVLAAAQHPDRDAIKMLENMTANARAGVIGLVVLAVAARFVRAAVERWRGTVHLTYPGSRLVSFSPGRSILDVSRENGIPHASVCGGRGRCSTCRVRITQGYDSLPMPSSEEKRVLDRIGSPINVRLACQTRPVEDLSIVPLLPPTATARDGFARAAQLSGQEKEIAILFADLRSFTKFSEARLPYDVVFVLNRYFANMGEAVEHAGGHLDKFIGDGVMALFGIDTDPAEACRQSLTAARNMAVKLAELNQTLAHELSEPLRIGIGVHIGPAIIGEMGYGAATTVTAIGDAVNTASRLETMTKEFGAQAVISDAVAERAGVDLSSFQRQEIDVRGKSETIPIRVVMDANDLKIS